MARQPGGEQVNVGELEAHQAELHFLVPAGEVEEPLERALIEIRRILEMAEAISFV